MSPMNGSARKPVWEAWNSGGGPKYPHEKVVQFTFRNFPAESSVGRRVLDLGCGSGVHARFFASEGFDVCGVDVSEVGVQNTRAALASAGLKGEINAGSVEDIAYPDGTFDLAVCVSVLECVGPEVATRGIRELVRVLAAGGKALLLFASSEDFRVRGANTYGLYGFSEAEVDAMLPRKGLSIRWIDRYITTHKNRTEQQNDFLVTLQKE